jgi:putative NADH-flavin reductase
MRITVFGASGATGQELVRQATAAGHRVTAVVRDPAKLPVPAHVPSGGLDVVRADVMDAEAIAPAVAGSDVVISALGPRPRTTEPVCGPGAEAIVAAMRASGARRLVVIAASGYIDDPADGFLTGSIAKPIVRRLLRRPFADMAHADRIVSGSGLDWTIMRPPRLTNGARRAYRTVVDRTVGSTLSRADLAAATLIAAGDPATIGHAIGVGY